MLTVCGFGPRMQDGVRLAEDEDAGETRTRKRVGDLVDDRRPGATKCVAESRGDFFMPELGETSALREIDRVERGWNVGIHPS